MGFASARNSSALRTTDAKSSIDTGSDGTSKTPFWNASSAPSRRRGSTIPTTSARGQRFRTARKACPPPEPTARSITHIASSACSSRFSNSSTSPSPDYS